MSKAKFGDIISVNRGLYRHFGIYAGNDRVIHYHKNRANGNKATIMETSMSEFLANSKSYKVDDNSEVREIIQDLILFPISPFVSTVSLASDVYRKISRKEYSAEETVARARSKIGETNYNIMTNNCEHFVEFCKTGVKHSGQVANVVKVFAKTFFRLR